jgi:hypothetical protein
MNTTDSTLKKTRSGRKVGAKSYDKAKLLNIIEAVLPSGSFGWSEVCTKYQQASGETIDRDWTAVKRYFIDKLCDNNKKPTGKSSPTPEVARAQKIYNKILESAGAGNLGQTADDDDDDDVDDEDGEDGNDHNDGYDNDDDDDDNDDLVPRTRLDKAVAEFEAEEVTAVRRPPKAEKSKSIKKAKIATNPRAGPARALTKLCESLAANTGNGSGTGTDALLAVMAQSMQQNSNMMMMMMMMTQMMQNQAGGKTFVAPPMNTFVTPVQAAQSSTSSSSSSSSSSSATQDDSFVIFTTSEEYKRNNGF